MEMKNKKIASKKMFKGEEVEAGVFFGTQVNIPVQVLDTTVPRCQKRWGNYGDGTLPKFLILHEGRDSGYGNESVMIRYESYPNWEDGRITVPINFKLRILSGAQGKKMMDAYAKHVMDCLEKRLDHAMKIGSDPEIFVERAEGELVHAFEFLGDKGHPNRSLNVEHGNMPVYWDGFQAEFETSAERCLAWQVDSVQLGLQAVLKFAKEHRRDAKLSTKTVMEIPQKALSTAEEKYVSFGCMPSLNAYGLSGELCPPRELPFRSAGGHIHFGIGKISEDNAKPIVKALDAILGVSCVSLFENWDNPVRRKYYGLPGEYRLPAHGIEYRVLSNAWLFHPLIMNLVFDLGCKALVFGQKGLLGCWKGSEGETIECVKNCDAKKAREIMERNKPVLVKIMQAMHIYEYEREDTRGLGTVENAELVYKIFFDGMESAVRDPTNISGNWDLEGGWRTHSDGEGKNWKTAWKTIAAGRKV